MLGDGNDWNATPTSPRATARFVAIRIVPHDKENRSLRERRGLGYGGYGLREEGISRGKRNGFEFAAGGAVLVVTEVGNDVDKSRGRNWVSQLGLDVT